MSIDVYEVSKKLIGPVLPVGETHTDERRYENLEKMIELANLLLWDIREVSKNKDRHEASMKKAGTLADEFLNSIKED